MARKHVEVDVRPIALKQAEAAAALGISVETFTKHVRPHLAALRIAGVTVYPVAVLQRFCEERAEVPIEEAIEKRRAA